MALGALDVFRSGAELLVAALARDLGMGTKVVVPPRFRGLPAFGGHDHVAFVVPGERDRRRAHGAALRARGRDEEQAVAEPADALALLRAELVDHVAIEVSVPGHLFTSVPRGIVARGRGYRTCGRR